MGALQKLSDLIDSVSDWLGRVTMWLVLAAVLISAGNAIIRKVFSVSSNAYLEVQWYLFAAVFMLGSAYVYLHNGHVRIDFIASRLSKRTNAIVDAIGIVVFVLPLCVILIYLSWPYFLRAYYSGEMSENAGGLIRWPVILLIPVGFSLLLVQALSELIKRVAFLSGARAEPFRYSEEKSVDDEIVAELVSARAVDDVLSPHETPK